MDPKELFDADGTIAISAIIENPVALRQVDREREEYQQLVQSVREHGVLQAILVRPDPANSGKVMLVDGAHRFTAAKDAGLSRIYARLATMDDDAALEKQMVANLHVVSTKPAEYANQLARFLARNPLLTIPELAQKLSKSTTWLQQRLKLTNLVESIQQLVDKGEIKVANGQALAMLPPEEQLEWIDRAMTMNSDEFLTTVKERTKAISAAKRAGRDPNAPTEFVPVAKLRKLTEVTELASAPAAVSAVIGGITDPVEAGLAVLKWVTRLDDASIAEQKAKDAERKRLAEEAKIKSRAERATQREKDAAEAKAKAIAEAEAAGVKLS